MSLNIHSSPPHENMLKEFFLKITRSLGKKHRKAFSFSVRYAAPAFSLLLMGVVELCVIEEKMFIHEMSAFPSTPSF